MKNYEDKIYSLGETVTGQTQAMSQAVQKTLENNGGVGIMTGSYDQNLSILSVNNLLLHSTGYTFDTFMEQTKGSLRNFFYDEEDILERDRFLQLHGTGEAQILTPPLFSSVFCTACDIACVCPVTASPKEYILSSYFSIL